MTRPNLPARATGRRLLGLLAVVSLVAAVAPAQVAAADPAAGYDVAWAITGADGLPRTDGMIAVGDDLQLTYVAVDGTGIIDCGISLSSAGGRLMNSQGRMADGACYLTVRLPDFPDPELRAAFSPDSSSLDLCVRARLDFADIQPREMTTADQMQPGGKVCSEFLQTPGDPNLTYAPDALDIPIEPGGTPREFISDPKLLSWNPADWGTGMTPLTFGDNWHYEAPAWVTTCTPYLNGEWSTIKPESSPACQRWDVRLPGVLPSNLPWSGPGLDGSWHFMLHTDYKTDQSIVWARTISDMRTPMAPSDTVFESSLPAIFPVDLATTRFVTSGERWKPVFQFSGGSVPTCTLVVQSWQPLLGDPITGLRHFVEEPYEAATDDVGRCAFDVPSFPEEMRGYGVRAGALGGMEYIGRVFNIPAPEPPTIEPPVEGDDGDTDIGVEPGDGQGLGLELEVTADSPTTPRLAAAADVVCHESVLSTDLENGGAIPHLDAECPLAPGMYRATARMVDAAGVVTTSTRSFTVLGSRPAVIGRTPSPGATSVARDARPTVTFDMSVTGVSASTVRLQDVGTGAYAATTVTYNAANHRATIRPAALLRTGHTYRLSVTGGIENAGGNPLLAKSWTFKVSTDAIRPTFVPTPGRSATGVGRGANVFLAFSETVRGVSPTTVQLRDTATGLSVAATVTYDAVKHRAMLNPNATLRGLRRYLVVISSGITDLTGNPLSGASWSFTTRP